MDATPLAGLASARTLAAYRDRGMAEWSDARLVAAASERLAHPKVEWVSSFVLHAPLELLARAGLLKRVRAHDREGARQRLVWMAARYAESGAELPDQPPTPIASLRGGVATLIAALSRGEQEEVDRLAVSLAAAATPAELRGALGEAIVPMLGAAAHAPILLYLLPRVAPAGELDLRIIRGPLRNLAREPDGRLRWMDRARATAPFDPRALLDLPLLGPPKDGGIVGLVTQAVDSGVAERAFGGVDDRIDLRELRRWSSRIAAWSMVQEPPDHAPYGWSHCLTIPQAVLDLAELGAHPRIAAMAAGTHLVSYRIAFGTGPLAEFRPTAPRVTGIAEAIAAGPTVAAAAAWHAREEDLAEIEAELATRAALHHDAHLAKYTLACFDALGADPEQRRLYLAAAAYLNAWWAAKPADELLAG